MTDSDEKKPDQVAVEAMGSPRELTDAEKTDMVFFHLSQICALMDWSMLSVSADMITDTQDSLIESIIIGNKPYLNRIHDKIHSPEEKLVCMYWAEKADDEDSAEG